MTRINSSADFAFQKLASGKPVNLTLTDPQTRDEAKEWYRNVAKDVTSVDINRFVNRAKADRKLAQLKVTDIGKMMCFFYDAKLKEELPYWDRFPLIFMIGIYDDGFLGINLHYLPPMYRANLMDQLYNILLNERFDDTTKLRISYKILNSAAKYRSFKPCVKRYLSTHVKSLYVNIKPNEWDMALLLPTERFVKKSKENVWMESVKQINNRGKKKRGKRV